MDAEDVPQLAVIVCRDALPPLTENVPAAQHVPAYRTADGADGPLNLGPRPLAGFGFLLEALLRVHDPLDGPGDGLSVPAAGRAGQRLGDPGRLGAQGLDLFQQAALCPRLSQATLR